MSPSSNAVGSIKVIFLVKVLVKLCLIHWFSDGTPLFATAQPSGEPQQPQSQNIPFWMNEVTNEVNRDRERDRVNKNKVNRFGVDEYKYSVPRDKENVRHFHHLNIVQGQQVYNNHSAQIGFMILAPSIIQPSSIFKAIVTINDLTDTPRLGTLLNHKPFVDVRLALFRDGADIQGFNKLISAGSSDTLQIRVPGQLPKADYKIRIEGNHPETTGGTLFASESPLTFSEKFLSILVQTNRYVFSGGQKVFFRVIALKRDLLPYEDPVDIYILDSRGLIMRRWPSRVSNNGVLDMEYELPPFTALGKWKIRVVANSQIQDKYILLEKYFQPLHEVFVTMDPFILSTEDSFSVTISSFYGTEKTVRGNTTCRIYGSYYGKNPRRKDWTLITAREFFLIGEEELTFEMYEISQTMGDVTNVVIRVEADVKEYFIDETRFGFAESRIIRETIQVKFLGNAPPVFKPGLPFHLAVGISTMDLEKVSEDRLKDSIFRVRSEAFLTNGQRIDLGILRLKPSELEGDDDWASENEVEAAYQRNRDRQDGDEDGELLGNDVILRHQVKRYLEEATVEMELHLPKHAARLVVSAEYSDESGAIARGELTAAAAHSPSAKYLKVVLKTSDPISVGQFVVLHLYSNFAISHFHFVVIAKGMIISHGTERLSTYWSLPKSFTVVVGPEMSPGFRVFVYCDTRRGEIVTDSMFIPVHNLYRHRAELHINQAKDRSKDSVEFRFVGAPAAYFGSSVQRSVRHLMQAGNELTPAYVLNTLHSLEPWNRSLSRLVRRQRSGEKPDEVLYFQSSGYALDSYSELSQASLLMFTDGHVPRSAALVGGDECPEEACLTVYGCFRFVEKCDGIEHGKFWQVIICPFSRGRIVYNSIQQCQDKTDELDCDFLDDEDIHNFRVTRISRFADFYDPTDGDWAWNKKNINHGGDVFLTNSTPGVTDTWHLSGFAVSKQYGFALIDNTIEYETLRPFLMVCDAPSSIRRGEHVGIIAMLYNKTPKEMLVMVSLAGSEDYEFVHVGKNGLMNFDESNPRFSSGEHQHLVWMAPESEIELRLPIRPTVDQGTISVEVTATSQIRSQTATLEIDVLADGVQIGKHTSVLLDLRNRAFLLKYMNIFVEELPEIPYDIITKYVHGSPAGHVTVSGDVIGPAASLLPVSMASLIGREGKGTDDRIFDLASNTWTLHYLRLTNQLKSSVAKPVFKAMNMHFAEIMKRFNANYGWFKTWNLSKPSVWLTSWALQVFAHANFQDWENNFYVERRIFNKAFRWLLRYQHEEGWFYETRWYIDRPLNKRMGFMRNMNMTSSHVTLTAHLVITMSQVMGILDGELRVEASIAKAKALHYLERQLADMVDPYLISITAYALMLADSSEKELAFGKLHAIRREEAELVYWSPGEVPTNGIVYENQRPFLQPKNNEYWDAIAVEGTSYALLVYLTRDGISPITDSIVTWLNTMRLTDGAFISTVDTVVAFQALCEYANRARMREITDLTVYIEISSQQEVAPPDPIKFAPDSVSETHTIDMELVWGHVNIDGRGAGQAVVQLDLTYGIDWEAYKDSGPVDPFELTIVEHFGGRNKSILTIVACFKWILLEESETSGATVLEVEIPSGYGLLQSDALRLVASGVHPTLRDSIIRQGKTSWFFEYIPSYLTCLNHTVFRWYPVGNLTTHRQATIYEAYAPERFINTIYNDTSMRLLDICHVCGSFQCPYCPFYNAANGLTTSQKIFVLVILPVILKSLMTRMSGAS